MYRLKLFRDINGYPTLYETLTQSSEGRKVSSKRLLVDPERYNLMPCMLAQNQLQT